MKNWGPFFLKRRVKNYQVGPFLFPWESRRKSPTLKQVQSNLVVLMELLNLPGELENVFEEELFSDAKTKSGHESF